jgi:FtsP/CotA-like multicopper oxidase with cupredoxin domain
LTLPAPVGAAVTPPGSLFVPGEIRLAPANRSDVLVQLATPGWYQMVDGAAIRNGLTQHVVGYIYVEPSETTPTVIPSIWNVTNPAFPVQEPRIADVTFTTTGTQTVNFQVRANSSEDEGCADCPEPGDSGVTPGPMMAQYFCMWNPENTPSIDTPKNGDQVGAWPAIDSIPDILYSQDKLDYCVVQNTADEWTLYNYSTAMHLFHIHVNPFYVTAHGKGVPGTKGNPPVTPVNRWQDVVGIPSALFDQGTGALIGPGFITFKTRYLNYTGDYVAHCHKVNHEDTGMMVNVRVADNAGALTCPTDPYAPDPSVPYIPDDAPSQCDDE